MSCLPVEIFENEDFVFAVRMSSREREMSTKRERILHRRVFERNSRRNADRKRSIDAQRVEISRMIQNRKKKSRTPLRCVRDCCIVVKYRVSSETNAVETVENPTKSDARTFRKKEDHVHTLHACVVPSVSNVIIPRFLNTQRHQEGKEEEEKRRRRFCSRRRTYRNVLDVIHTRAS